jgi:formate dehydrogenase major subunit
LGTSFGRGGATTFQQDLAEADCILIMGSNMAECHPVGFQWVMEARERGAEIIHVDPRFTRTSAVATKHVALRAGSDIVFLGAIVNHILTHGREFREYVEAYTNAAAIIDEGFRDTEDLDGLFSGFDPEKRAYDTRTWQYDGMELHAAAGHREQGHSGIDQGQRYGGIGAHLPGAEAPHQDPTLEDPRCVFQILKRHFRRYTPELVEELCGVPAAKLTEIAETLCDNSGRERTTALCYAVGWTQHTVGVQLIRTAAIIQLLLGNIGRPGGGIMALRGHASIQGSTDIPTLYNLLPGYLPMPHAVQDLTFADYVSKNTSEAGYWANFEQYFVSLMRAWWGPAATAGNDWGYGFLPRIDQDHSVYRTVLAMLDGSVEGYIVAGENPAVGSANSRLHRLAFAKLKWLVVRDLVEIETATFWKSCPEIESGELRTEDIATEVFLLPAAAHTEKDGSFTNTQRLLQWHHKAVEPPGDCRSELWFYYHLGRRIREKLAGSSEPRDEGIRALCWDYPTHGAIQEPSAEAVLAEINGVAADGEPLSTYDQLSKDGSTSCGCWIYCGAFAGGVNQAARRKPRDQQTRVAPEWGWSWPANRRLLYNRASADPEGRPWSERKRYVWWDAAAGKWTGEDVPDFKVDRPPDYTPPEGAPGPDLLSGADPFVMQADGRGWLFVPSGVVDGPLPTHYEPHESPVENALYGQQSNPVRQVFRRRYNEYNPPNGAPGSDRYPFVLTTYRLTEHHTAGGMSRFVGVLSELQPAFFCEVSPELAALRGLEHGGWATVITTRTAIEARVIVSDRIEPLHVQGRAVHQVGLPYHWGWNGLSTGDTANDLFSIVLDPDVHIQEVKAATCDVQPGRRPRGPALRRLVDQHATIGSEERR